MNGKVERAQQTDLKGLRALVDFSEDRLGDQLAEYQHYYNWDRIHGSLGETPMDRVVELSQRTPFGIERKSFMMVGKSPFGYMIMSKMSS